MDTTIKLIPFEPAQEEISFLSINEDKCLFLYSNLIRFGAKKTSSPYSGDVYGVWRDKSLIGSFMVTQTGNLLYLFQSHDDITPEIYDLWSKSNITGILGEYPICEQIHENLKWDKTTFGQPKEVLMRLDLPKHAVTRVDIGDTRFLVDDFDQYWILSGDFCKEMGLKLEEKEFGRSQFVLGCSNRIHFGTFVDGSLVSIARLNSHAKTSGIIGRVFTDQKHRGKGYSYRTISLLIQETSRELKKLLLFTDPKGGALNLYRRLGFIEIGHVGMFVK